MKALVAQALACADRILESLAGEGREQPQKAKRPGLHRDATFYKSKCITSYSIVKSDFAKMQKFLLVSCFQRDWIVQKLGLNNEEAKRLQLSLPQIQGYRPPRCSLL